MEEQHKNKKKDLVAKYIKELSSSDESKVENALEELMVHGNVRVISAFAEMYANSSKNIQHQILDFLADIRNEDAPNEIVKIIETTKDETVRTAFLSSIWSSSLDYSDHLNVFVKIAMEGRLEDAIECYTIISNMEGPFDEDVLLEAKMNLKSNFEQISSQEQRFPLLTEIMQKINEFDKEI